MSIRAAVSAFIASLKRPGDPYFDNVAALLHMDGADGGTVFPDVNGRTWRIWTASASQTKTAQAKFGVSSMRPTTESGSYISTPSHADFDFGEGDFTVEMWVYKTAHAAGLYEGLCVRDAIGGTRGWLLYKETTPANALGFAVYVGATAYGIADTVAMDLNVWTHVAATRRAGTLRLFKNGALVASRSDLGVLSVGAPAQPCVIGSLWGNGSVNPSTSFLGYLDEARITKGVARYTSAFLVPARFPDANTTDENFDKVVALLHFDGAAGSTAVLDVSSSPKTFTAAGGAAMHASSRFGQSSLRLAASGDYVSTTNSTAFDWGVQDFCIEGWICPDNVTGIKDLFQSYGSVNASGVALQQRGDKIHVLVSVNGAAWAIDGPATSSTLVAGQWSHVALTRVAGVFRLFSDGVLVYENSSFTASAIAYTSANQVRIGVGPAGGNQYLGNIDDFRITRGAGRYASAFTVLEQPFPNRPRVAYDAAFDSVSALLHFDGADGSSTFKDEKGATWSRTGTAALSTAFRRMGSACLSIGVAGDYLSTPAAAEFNFGSGDFTVELFVCPTELAAGLHLLLTNRAPASSDPGFFLALTGTAVRFGAWGPPATLFVDITGGTLTAGAWHHIAVVRSGTAFTLYLDGVSVGSATSATAIADSAFPLIIGTDPSTVGRGYVGLIDELRLTKGIARYAGAFTPAMEPFGGPGPKAIAMQFDSGDAQAVFTDTGTAGTTWTVGSGAVVCSTAVVLDGVSSLFLPSGGSAYLVSSVDARNLLPASKDFSLRFRARASSWLRPDTAGCYILSVQDGGSTGPGTQFAIATNSSQFPALVYSDGTTRSVATGTAAIPTNTNLLFELVRTGSTLALKIDGAVVVSVSFPGAFPQPATPWRIGAPALANSAPTNGMYFDSFTLTA